MRYDKVNNILIMTEDESTIVVSPGAHDIYIGVRCKEIDIDGKCKAIYIGDDNSNIKLASSSYVQVDDSNIGLSIDTSVGTRIGFGNRDITIGGSRGSIVKYKCNGVNIVDNASNNVVDRSDSVHIRSDFNLVRESNGVTIDHGSMKVDAYKVTELDVKNSLDLTTLDSVSVQVSNTNNSDIRAMDLNVINQRSYRSYISQDSQKCRCRLKENNKEDIVGGVLYDVDKSNGDIKMKGTPTLIDCPADDEGIYARYKGQWININELMTGPVDPEHMYARYNGQWVVAKTVDPALPPPDPPKATNSIDPDSIRPQNPKDYVVKQ